MAQPDQKVSTSSGPLTSAMTLLGYNFATLKVPVLVEICMHLDISIPFFNGPKPLKGDYIFFIERHFALERVRLNKAPDHYLFPSFDAGKQYAATLRQIFAQHGMRYIDEEGKRSTFDAKKPELVAFFADKIDEMRRDRGFQVPKSLDTDTTTQDFSRMKIPSEGELKETSGQKPTALKVPESFKTLATPSANAQPAKNPLGVDPNALRPIFGAAWQPSQPTHGSAFESTAKQHSSFLSTTKQTSTFQSAPKKSVEEAPVVPSVSQTSTATPSSSRSSISSPATSPSGADPTSNSATTLMDGIQPEVACENARVLTQRKRSKLSKEISDAMARTIVCIHRNDIGEAAVLLDQLHMDLIDELAVPTEKRAIELVAHRALSPRRITKVVKIVEDACASIVTFIQQSMVAEAISALVELQLDIEEEF